MTSNRTNRRLRRSTVIPALLIAYLATMAYIGWPEYASGRASGLYYWGLIILTLAVIFLLHLNLKKREQKKDNKTK